MLYHEFEKGENINNNIERNNLYAQNIFVGFNENTLNESYLPQPGKSKIIKRQGWLSIKIDHIFRQEKVINTVAWIAKLGGNPEYKFENLYKVKSFKNYYDTKLLKEVTNIVEDPQVLLVDFDKKYLELPKEIIISTLQNSDSV